MLSRELLATGVLDDGSTMIVGAQLDSLVTAEAV